MFICWWFPIGLYNNTSLTSTTDSRATLAFLFVVAYMVYVSTFAALMIAGLDSSDTAANMGNLLGFLMLLFCGILAAPRALPGFWMFMYRVNPFTYLTEGLLGAGLSRADAHCADNEWLQFAPPSNLSCGQYMAEYMSYAGGELLDSNAMTLCQFCPVTETDQLLSAVGVKYSHRWRDLGILVSFIVFNCFGAVMLYWVARVPKSRNNKKPKNQG
jgi:ATP-binding cassette, subfamily G (WHITE), member 2, PDR